MKAITITIRALLLVALLTIAPLCTALSAPAQDVSYTLYVSGVQITPENQDDIFGDGTAIYKPDEKKLTLRSAKLGWTQYFPTENMIASIYAEDDLTIELFGENQIPALFTGQIDMRNYGIYGKGNVTFGGSAHSKLLIGVGETMNFSCGIYAAGTISVSAGVTVQSGCQGSPAGTNCTQYGVYAEDKLHIREGSTLIACTAERAIRMDYWSAAVHAEDVTLDAGTLLAVCRMGALKLTDGSKLLSSVEGTRYCSYAVTCSKFESGEPPESGLDMDSAYVLIQPYQK